MDVSIDTHSRLAVADLVGGVSAFLHFGQGSDHTLHLGLRGSFVNIARQETFIISTCPEMQGHGPSFCPYTIS